MDYANQIANMISQYLPYTGINFGRKYRATNLELTSTKMTMTFSDEDYAEIRDIINDALYPNTTFTSSGFYLKNRIVEFSKYPDDVDIGYGFFVKFLYPHRYENGQEITLEGFDNAAYNDHYKILRVVDSYRIVIYPPDSITVATVEDGLGFIVDQYTEGFNGIQEVSDEGDNKISFEFEAGSSFTVSDINDIDILKMPYLYDYSKNIKVINAEVFFRNKADSQTEEFLIIDTTSLAGSPMRSQNNKGDNSYSAYSRSANFDKNYSINVIYLLERSVDANGDQASSGSDIVEKQIKMHDALTSITRQPLNSDETKLLSSMTITNDSVISNILEGSVRIIYQFNFAASFLQKILLRIDQKNKYKINSVKVGNDVISFS